MSTPMKTLILQRLSQDDYATFGYFADQDDHREICKTLELPWHDNVHDRSCIPPGAYTCRRRYSEKHKGEVFEITGVPGRGDIEIHSANWPSQLLGCVATGTAYGIIEGKRGVTDSRAAFARFMAHLEGEDAFALTVTDPAATIVVAEEKAT